ncbi:DUF4328 domain-containing protein [Marinifilum caeruleilacunae]|uniref:DUF4328 domain-containing protein n=1 Tax=Marinifilum caeruleilacunae TaxID=2499076 RepID=A0ABX1WWF9_9BACT|nr:DUF4328 domain-containing protein [Marinifilum caeruleilacunae]NOU60392.1 DUF4328 domain-containing protein [Marinifilum caeruleilacunae]
MKQIETCKSCENRKFDTQQGILCSLTDAKPIFEEICSDYVQDEKTIQKKLEVSKFILPNQKLANALMWVMWLVLATQLLGMLSHYMQYNLLTSALNGETVTTQMAEDNDIRHTLIMLVHYLAFIGSAVLFAIWFYRGYKNYHTRFKHPSYNKSWAIWGWIVPIASLFIPYKIMNEMYNDSKKKLLEFSEDYSFINMTSLITFWWVLWILSNFVSNIVSKFFEDEETIQGLIDYSMAEMILGVFFIPAAIITFKLIKDYSFIEEKLTAFEAEELTLHS